MNRAEINLYDTSHTTTTTQNKQKKPEQLEYELSEVVSNDFADHLICPICKVRYNMTNRAAITLPCSHNVCMKEMEAMRAIECPKCHQEHEPGCKIKMDMEVLEVLQKIQLNFECQKHHEPITSIDLSNHKGLCAKCIEETQEKILVQKHLESVAQFMEKMKEIRRWRKQTEKKLILSKNAINNAFRNRLTQLQAEIDQHYQNNKTELSEQRCQSMKLFLEKNLNDLKSKIGEQPYESQSKLGVGSKYLELDLFTDAKSPIYVLKLDDLRSELAKWSHSFSVDTFFKSLKEIIARIMLKNEWYNMPIDEKASKDNDMNNAQANQHENNLENNQENNQISPLITFGKKSDEVYLNFLIQHKLDYVDGVQYGMLGIIKYRQKSYQKGLNYFKQSFDINQTLFQKNKHMNLARVQYGTGLCEMYIKNSQKAIQCLESALQIACGILEEDDLELADYYNGVGIVYGSIDNIETAIDYLYKSLKLRIDHKGIKNNGLISTYNNIGILYRQIDDYNHGLNLHQKALDLARDLYGEESIEVANCYYQMGQTKYFLKQFGYAQADHLKAFSIRRNLFGVTSPEVMSSLVSLGTIYKKQGNVEKAYEALINAKKIGDDLGLERQPSEILSIHGQLCSLGFKVQHYSESIECGLMAAKVLENSAIPGDKIKLSKVYVYLGNSSKRLNDNKSSMMYYSKAYDVKKKELGVEHKDTKQMEELLKREKNYKPTIDLE